MKLKLLITALLIIVAGTTLTVVLTQSSGPQPSDIPPAAEQPSLPAPSPQPYKPSPDIATGMHAQAETRKQLKLLAPHEEFKGFADMTPKQRLDLTATLKNSGDLPQDVREYIKQAIRVRTLDPVVRNLMANCLFHSNVPDPDLHQLFIDFYDDPDETETFRDFAVQFLSRNYETASEKKVIRDKLKDISLKDPSRIAGTAIVQLTHLEQEGLLKLEDGFFNDVVKRAGGKSEGLSVKVAILGVIGRRGTLANEYSVEFTRSIVQDETVDDSLLRTAIGMLGLVGTPEDKALIEFGLTHKNRAVQMAAKAAMKRLQSKINTD